jgi:hypothetical protein
MVSISRIPNTSRTKKKAKAPGSITAGGGGAG